MTQAQTHLQTDPSLVGEVVSLQAGSATAQLLTTQAMAVDAQGLVHGGFIFGLADYAAMLAVNHPNVVLGSAEVRFVAPVGVDCLLIAQATLLHEKGKKRVVEVSVRSDEHEIFAGSFTCFVLEQHVMENQ